MPKVLQSYAKNKGFTRMAVPSNSRFGLPRLRTQWKYGMWATLLDITERKQAERRLAIQNAAMRIMSEEGFPESSIHSILDVVCSELNLDMGAFWLAESGGGSVAQGTIPHPQVLHPPLRSRSGYNSPQYATGGHVPGPWGACVAGKFWRKN